MPFKLKPDILLILALLAFSPIWVGGNRPLPLLVMTILGLMLWGATLWKTDKTRTMRLPHKVLILLIFTLFLIELLPVPIHTLQKITPLKFYTDALLNADPNALGQWRPMSLDPNLTLQCLLNLVAPLAVFMATLKQAREDVTKVATFLVGVTILEALYGLTQVASGTVSATGTFNYRNAFAGYLVMSLSLSLGLTAGYLNRFGGKVLHLLQGEISWRLSLTGLALVVLPLTIIFTQSRMGMMTGLLLLGLSFVAFGRKLAMKKLLAIFFMGGLFFVTLALMIGVVPSLNRFIEQDAMHDLRWPIFKATLLGIGQFFPFGSGPGTFSEVFLRFQLDPVLAGVFINHAHNEYLEWIFEGGAIAVLAVILFVVIYLAQWLKVVTSKHAWRRLDFLRVGAGLGTLMMMIHCLVDYNLHVPANQIALAVLLGLFFYEGEA